MNMSIWGAILVMGAVSCVLRALPLTLIRRQIKSRFFRSVLFYLPYATLAVMTFPAITQVADNPLCGLAALIGAAVVAWTTSNLLMSAIVACVAVFIVSIL